MEMHILVTSMLSALTARGSDPKVSSSNMKVNSTAVAQFCTGFNLYNLIHLNLERS